jgi:hypothetical protein
MEENKLPEYIEMYYLGGWLKRKPVFIRKDICISEATDDYNNLFLLRGYEWRYIKPEPVYKPFTQETIKPFVDRWFQCKKMPLNYWKITSFNTCNVYFGDNFITYQKLVDDSEMSSDLINWQPAGIKESSCS